MYINKFKLHVSPSKEQKWLSIFFSLSIRPWGLLMAAGVVACLATLAGFLGQFSWFFDLFSHFRVQYLIGLTVIGTLFIVVCRRKTGGVFLGFAFVNLMLVLPLYFNDQIIPPKGAPVLRAMLLNVNTRLGDANKVKLAIRNADPDILILEEVSCQWLTDLACLANSHPHSLTQPRNDNFGIALFSKFPLAESEVVYIGDADVPSIFTTVRTGRTNLRVIATHPLPPSGRDHSRWRDEQLDLLPDRIRPGLPLILLGDLNVTPWSYHFRRFLKRTGLKNSSQGRGVQPTWPNYNLLLLIPIDHCLHSSNISVVDKKIGADVSSDHYPVIVDFVLMPETEK